MQSTSSLNTNEPLITTYSIPSQYINLRNISTQIGSNQKTKNIKSVLVEAGKLIKNGLKTISNMSDIIITLLTSFKHSDLKRNNSFQEITICNALPSILKCQNKRHLLFIKKVIYGISSPSGIINKCLINSSCRTVYNEDKINCSGLNYCVIESNHEILEDCYQIKSNLTRIFVSCISLGI